MSKITRVEQATDPATPASGEVVEYAKTDHQLYWRDPTGSIHPMGAMGLSAGTQSVASGTMVFSNSNNVTFGMSGSSQITASASFAQTTQPAVNLAAGTQTATSGTVVFSNSNGISFGMSGSTRITASADDVKSISAGNTRITNGEVVFSNSNGISFGINGQTVTASPVRASWWYNHSNLAQHAIQMSTLYVHRVSLPLIDATQMDILLNISNSSSAGATLGISAGLYSMSGSSMSLLSSASRAISYNSTLAASSYTNVSNTKFWSIPLGTWVATPGHYMLGFLFSISTALTSGTVNVMGALYAQNGVEYNPAGSHNYTKYWNMAGVGTASMSTLPASAQISDFNWQITFLGNFPPFMPQAQLVGTF